MFYVELSYEYVLAIIQIYLSICLSVCLLLYLLFHHSITVCNLLVP